jgi:hypothetical protein
MLKELRAIRREVEKLRCELKEIKKELAKKPETKPEDNNEAAAALPFGLEHDNFTRKSADRKALGALKLPDKENVLEVKEYVNKILELSARQNCFSTDDPQVGMLARIESRNIDVLIDVLRVQGHGHGDGSYYLLPAIERLANDNNKALILENFETLPTLAKTICSRRWHQDAKQTVIKHLQTGLELPEELYQIAAMLNDKEINALILKNLEEAVDGHLAVQILEKLEMMPDVDPREAFLKFWKRFRFAGQEWAMQRVARKALAYGDADALKVLIISLQVGNGFGPRNYELQETMRALFRHTGQVKSPKDMIAWYEENKDRLKWNEEKKVFEVDEAKPANQKPAEKKPAPAEAPPQEEAF